jgi:hypothetical protein
MTSTEFCWRKSSCTDNGHRVVARGPADELDALGAEA